MHRINDAIRTAGAACCALMCCVSLAWGAFPQASVVAASGVVSASAEENSSHMVYGVVTRVASSAAAPASIPAPASTPPSTPAPASAASLPAASAVPPVVASASAGLDPHTALLLRADFARDVKRRLNVPAADQRAYGERLQAALEEKDLGSLSGEYIALVDRSQNVQALFIFFRTSPQASWQMIGASPVATGRPGQFDHFITPLGVFEHTPANMDFRAEGTENQNGVRGYGKRDMRIFDLGWAQGQRGWGNGGISQMRFQMHATDPDKLEPLLGIRHSKGCIRIPASLNVFLDHYGVLDAEYEALVRSGRSLWILHSDRQPTPWAGRYIVVVDSEAKARPAWSPAPGSKARARVPEATDTAD